MQLKKLEAYGFKSFADKIEVDFDKGITAIVGPNGSGKSNISDAIKWVLGEQNVRNIRGIKAEDIIFAGSETRRPMGVAEVSLYFDNDGTLPIDFNEVVVTRRLFRTGESEFYINKSRCRLKDIIELFADSGIGHDSMGIISQNKMDEILNARPEEKRLFFEEAAGISKYRSRKREALRKLEDTEGNLQRVHDILGEIENQLSPLAESAAKAKHYQELQEELSGLQLTVLYQQYQGLKESYGEFEHQLQEKRAQEMAANTARQLIEGRSSQLDVELLDLEKKLERLAKRRQEIHTGLEEADSRIKVLEERRRQGKANKQRHQQQIRQQQSAITEAGENVTGLEQAEKSAQEKKQSVEQDIAAKREKAKALRQSLSELRQEGQGFSRQKQKLEASMQSAEGRLQVLERLQSSYEGFGKAVKAVLQTTQPWKKGICGAVAELIEVPAKYMVAVETALGGSIQNIVARDTYTAKEAIAMLKANKLGRATFLPLSSIVVRPNKEQLPDKAVGIIGWAHQVVKVDAVYAKAVEFLLGRTLLVDTLDNALALNKSMGQRLRIVTLEGELLTPGGALTGGSQNHKESSFLNRREEIAKLRQELSAKEQQKGVLAGKLANIQSQYKKLDAEAEELSHATSQLEMKKTVLEQQVLRAREQILLRQREIQRCQEAIQQQNVELAVMEQELSDSMREISDLMESCQRQQQAYVKADEEHRSVYQRRLNRMAEKKNNDKEIREAGSRLQLIQNQLHQIELEAARVEYEMEQCQAKMLSDYGLVPERAAEKAQPLDAKELKKALSALERDVARLGPVNPNAPYEYEELQKRHGFLAGNADDLEKARQDLLELIERMEGVMTTQFGEAFLKINEYFGEIFVKLFGGGQAGIQLMDRENILESGVNIMVTVPGKKMQNLSVLSGGERALTVVALLFAFLKYRPAPFSVLDEIDAPLDEANIGRFGKFIQEYAQRTQFIIVTHRKGTMEAADTMYGVTIEDAGVSKILSVKLEDYQNNVR